MSLRRPEPADLPPLLAAASIWIGILAPWPIVGLASLASIAVARRVRARRSVVLVIAVGLVVGAASGWLLATRAATSDSHGVGPGRVAFTAIALMEGRAGPAGRRVVVDPERVTVGSMPDLPVAVTMGSEASTESGARLEVAGRFVPGASFVAGSRVAGTVYADRIEHVGTSGAPHVQAANVLRRRIRSVVEAGRSDADALVLGFLIGDTTDLSPLAMDDMRHAGLAHFVAVSGSNVALFLGLWWIVLAPLRFGAWARASLGIAGLLVFGALTRWEPSVVRASGCAAVLLVGRAAGIPLSGWSALGVAVAASLTIAGELASNVGFQLSVLATMGVMAASSLWSFRPTWIATALGATVGAQIAVAPVLVSTFGSIPLLAPLTNVAAMPLVTVATALGGLGSIIGWRPIVELASDAASGVLLIAGAAGSWPQVGLVGTMTIVGAALLAWRASRPRLAIGMAALVIAVSVWPTTDLPTDLPAVVFLDVGQGDAALIVSEHATVLIDGGPDPVVLARKLERHGVRHLDLLVVTHVHADHVGGLAGVVGRMPIARVSYDFGPHVTSASTWLEREIRRLGIPTLGPEPGTRVTWPDVEVEFAGPRRRYASPNDQSVVVVADVAGTRVLFPGDIEVHAQDEIEIADVDVLKVPHQGAATSDLEWLGRHAGETSVVSVGRNDFGHPDDAVIGALSAAGAEVRRTDLDGDVVLSAGSGP